MDSEHSRRIKRAVEGFAERMEDESQRKKLNGIANGERERQRAAFLVAFAKKIHAVIQREMASAGMEINSISQRFSDDAEARRNSIEARIDISGDEDKITLLISRGDQAVRLAFAADYLREVAVVSTDGSVNAVLTLDEIKDEKVGPLVASFVEHALRTL